MRYVKLDQDKLGSGVLSTLPRRFVVEGKVNCPTTSWSSLVGPWLGSGWVCFLANGRSSMAADVMANFRVGVEKRAGESVGVKKAEGGWLLNVTNRRLSPFFPVVFAVLLLPPFNPRLETR